MNHKEAMRLLMSDRRLLVETLMQIEDKSRTLVPFVLNPIQADMYETSTGRDIYVKPAQVGASSYFICDFLVDCLTIRGTTAVIISYDEFITGRLLRKAQAFYDYLHKRIPTIPELVHRSTYEKTFESMDSSFFISSARSFSGVRGETIHDLLIDEFAFWQTGDAERVFAAALQRVPLLPGTKVRIVSTPSGEDNDFYEVYSAAKEGKVVGKSIFTAHFYPWFIHPDYLLLPDSPYLLPGDDNIDGLNPDERLLAANFGLTSDQIRWRRYKIAEMSSLRRSGETRLLFSQEYPENDVDCFLAAGDMTYDHELVNELARKCYPAPIRHLYADVWYPPEGGVKYLVAIDPGQGISSESVATVWQFTDFEFKHCATLSGLYPPSEMAEKSIPLALYYNNALIANEDSLEFTTQIKGYNNLYFRTDLISGKVGKLIGWATTPKTKPHMIREVGRHLDKILTHDIRVVSQLRNIRWIQGARGDRAVAIGADDYHDSLAVALVCRDSMPIDRGLVGCSGWKQNWGR